MSDHAQLGRPGKPEPPQRRDLDFRRAVDRLVESPAFWNKIRGGYSAWVYLDHAPGRRGANRHSTAWRFRLAAPDVDLYSDTRVAIQPDGPEEEVAAWTPLANVLSFRCAGCDARLSVSELELLRLVIGSLFNDTRGTAGYISVLR